MSDAANRIEAARRAHAAAVLEYQTNPYGGTYERCYVTRVALELEVRNAKLAAEAKRA